MLTSMGRLSSTYFPFPVRHAIKFAWLAALSVMFAPIESYARHAILDDARPHACREAMTGDCRHIFARFFC